MHLEMKQLLMNTHTLPKAFVGTAAEIELHNSLFRNHPIIRSLYFLSY
jgi:hypothetical protein